MQAAAVGKHVERADAAGESREVQEFMVQRGGRKLKEQLAFLCIPVIRNEAVGALEASGAGGEVHLFCFTLRLLGRDGGSE